jgi:hypothetical protein
MGAADVILALVSGFPSGERERRILMVLQACIDDSGELEETINPAFVLAGFIAESEAWADFSTHWSETLHSHPSIEYFKMVEASNKRGQFRGWSDEQINVKIAALAKVIKQHAGLRVSVSVDKHAFVKHLRSLKTAMSDA